MVSLRKISILFFSFSLLFTTFSCDETKSSTALYLELALVYDKTTLEPNEPLTILSNIKRKSRIAITYTWFVNNKLQAGKILDKFTFVRSPLKDTTYTITLKITQGIHKAEQSCNITVKAVKPPLIKFNEPTNIFKSQDNFSYSLSIEDPQHYPLDINWYIDDTSKSTLIPVPPKTLSINKTTIENLLPNYFKDSSSIKYNLIATAKNPYKESSATVHFIITDDFYFTFDKQHYNTVYGHPIYVNLICNAPSLATFDWKYNDTLLVPSVSSTTPITSWRFDGISEDLTKDVTNSISVTATFNDSSGTEKTLTQDVPFIISKQNSPTLFLQAENKTLIDNEQFSYSFFHIQNDKELVFSFTAFDPDNDILDYNLLCNGSPILINDYEKKFVIKLKELPLEQADYFYQFSVNDGFTTPVVCNFSIRITQGPTTKIIHYKDREDSFSHDFNFPQAPKNVTLLFTNASNETIESVPIISLNETRLTSAKPNIPSSSSDSKMDFNAFPLDEKKLLPLKKGQLQSRAPANERIFYNCQYRATSESTVEPIESSVKEISAKLLFSHKVDYIMPNENNPPPVLEIWVATDCLAPSQKASSVTLEMAKTLAYNFIAPLQKNASSDIYHLCTSILGKEWSPQFSNPFDPFTLFSNKIVFLLYDFDGNRTVLPTPSDSVLSGFYHSKDNFKPQALQYSNSEIMLYLDAVLFAAKNDTDSWSLTEGWPSIILSTVIHEFQHLINFYQKIHHANNNSFREELWLNEVCSLMLEDLLCGKFLLDGPRAVSYTDLTEGPQGNTKGRIPLFNAYHHECAFFTNDSQQFSLQHYSQAYAFGAWLLRNFDGPTILQKLTQSPFKGMENISRAIYEITRQQLDEKDILSKFYSACYLSSIKDIGEFYQFNKSTPFNFLFDKKIFELGSLNFFNYSYQDLLSSETIIGPKTFTQETIPNKIMPYGAYFVTLPSFATNENRQYSFTLPKNIDLTILIQ